MPKKGRFGSFENFLKSAAKEKRQREMHEERGERRIREAPLLQKKFTQMLENARQFHQGGRAHFGIPPADYSLAQKRIEKLGHRAPVTAYIDAMFESGIPHSVIEKALANSQQTLPGAQGLETYIRQKYFGAGLVSEAIARNLLRFKDEGETWIRKFIDDQLVQKQFRPEDMHAVQVLASQAMQVFGASGDLTTRLMFMCSGEEVEGRRAATRSVARLENVIGAHIQEGKGKEEGIFFMQIPEFVSVYADITAEVIKRAKSVQARDEIDRNSRIALSQFLLAPEWQIPSDPWEKRPGAFDAFRHMLEERKRSPWVIANTRNMPFDSGKVAALISREMPRGLIGESLSFLNNYDSVMLAHRVDGLVQAIEKVQKSSETKQWQSAKLPGPLLEKVEEMLVHVSDDDPRVNIDVSEEQEQVNILRKYVGDNLGYEPEKKGSIHPIAALLRTISAKRIVTNDTVKQQFDYLLSHVPSLRLPPPGSVTENEERGIARRIAVLAASVRSVLETKDPYLDIPLPGKEDFSVRLLLSLRARQWLDSAVLARGPFSHIRDSAEPERALFTPRDLLEMPEEQVARLRRNFNTAKGTHPDAKRRWIMEAAHTWNALGDKYYEKMRTYAIRQVEKYTGTQDKYSIVPYPSATAAANEIVARLVRPIGKGDYIIVSRQEFANMTGALVEAGAAVVAIDMYDEAGKPKSAEEVFTDIEKKIKDRGREPIVALVSSKTRLGDAVCVERGFRTSNIRGISRLFGMLEEKYPSISKWLDLCQSVGRNDRAENELVKSNSDVFFLSGGKAPGIDPNIGVAGVRKIHAVESAAPKGTTYFGGDLEDVDGVPEPQHWLSHLEDVRVWNDPALKLGVGKSTMNIQQFAALGIALQWQGSRINTWRPSFDTEQSMREMTAQHLQELTWYAIGKADEYYESLLLHPDFPFPVTDEVLKDPPVRHQFGCLVKVPGHRKQIDYDGIITVAFPNLGSYENRTEVGRVIPIPMRTHLITDELAKYPGGRFDVEQFLPGNNGVRIDFHNLTEKIDIDRLFEALQRIHIAYLKKEIARKDIRDLQELVEKTPDVPDTWMEA